MDYTQQANGYNNGGDEFDPQNTLSDDIRRYAGLLWHWFWLLILLSVIGAGLGFYFSSNELPIYRAATTLYLSEAPATRTSAYADLLTNERLASTYAELITKRPVLEEVIAKLGLTDSPADLKRGITVLPIEGTQLIEITVVYGDNEKVAAIANEIGEVFAQQTFELQESRYVESKGTLEAQLLSIDQQIEQTTLALQALPVNLTTTENGNEIVLPDDPDISVERNRLETNLALYRQIYASVLSSLEQVRLSEIESTSKLVKVEDAIPPHIDEPISPNILQDTVLAAIVGLLLAAGIIFLIELLDDTIKGPYDVTRHLGAPILGFVASFDSKAGPITAIQPRSPISEAFRSIRTSIQFAGVDKPIKTLLITSPSPQDGKSTIATNMTVVIAQSGRPVTLIDADLRRPSQHKRLGLQNRSGLSDLFMQEKIVLDGALKSTSVPGMFFIGSGGLPPNPAELIGSEKMMSILHQIRQKTELIVIDSPPIMAVTDATVLSSRVDGVVLVVRPGKTKLAHAKHTVEQLRRSGANLLGVVLNDVERRRSRYYYYYKGYYASHYYYGDLGRKKKKRRSSPRKESAQT